MRRIGRYVSIIVGVTIVLLVYVHQQIVNIQVSYRLNSQETTLLELNDTNKNLKFQLSALKSPATLEQKLAEADINLVLPSEITIVKVPVEQPQAMHRETGDSQATALGILDFFGLDKEAQAELTP